MSTWPNYGRDNNRINYRGKDIKSACKHASSVELMSLVDGGGNGRAHRCSKPGVHLSARVRS